jgi:Ca2+-transporting ATPase
MNMPLPFLATQILWINLVTNGLQDIALAYEPGETGMFVTKPRNPKENIINFFVWKRLFLVGVTMAVGTVSLFWLKLNSGASLPYARTVAFNTVVFFQFFHVLNSRSFDKSIFSMSPFSNMFLFISLFLSIMAQLSVLYVPALKYVFHTEALDLSTWIQIISVSFSILLVMEADKFIRSKLK